MCEIEGPYRNAELSLLIRPLNTMAFSDGASHVYLTKVSESASLMTLVVRDIAEKNASGNGQFAIYFRSPSKPR